MRGFNNTTRNRACSAAIAVLDAIRYSVRMRRLRDRVRLIALLWLVGQAVSLAAFVPENCCISHLEERAAKDRQDACHEAEPAPEPAPGDVCPMQHDTGAACPMHAGKATDRCAMSNACGGPGTHLLSLFAYLGAIERPVTTEFTLDDAAAMMPPPARTHFRTTTPDAPPPKA
jgi:hypothetical protein